MLAYINRYHILAILMIAYAAIWIDKGVISLAIIPISNDFNFTKNQAGILMSAYYLGHALISFPGDILSDLFGFKKVITGCMVGAAFFCFPFPSCSVLPLFILIRFLLGVSHGSAPSASSKAIALNYSREQRIMIQSIWFTGGSISGCILACVRTRLITIDWTLEYYSVAACFIISGLLTLTTMNNIKKPQSREKTSTLGDKKNILNLLTDRNVIILAISVLAFNLVLNGSIWFPSFLMQKFNLSLIDIGYIQSINAFIGIITPLLGGFLYSKIFNNRENIFISSVITGACYLVFILPTSVILVVASFVLSMLTSMFIFITIKNLSHKIITEKLIGTSTGVITAISSFGGFVAPTLLGFIIDHSGNAFGYAYYMLSVIILIGGIVCLFGIKEKNQKIQDTFSSETV
ncbi:TPA: MFS transporter [Klebsiella variicola subsp. variicola]